ncbi:hypothetical protein VY88_26270 [Azospirillum thiophilum]|uniref:Uncharacterized protein n=1 Tax=Azospirillum thiophilum TaxID=528244 RepID=A0AAC8W4M3_9PROT|nr:hypothetical protein [Azospirillum thiophilum]ALG75045.1 hypothetical protein AL072_29180 [Azospirillum thiophilum]KJR62437.1 hypothetical protein VY88_26270 [Azospirillum thiophilum]
MTTPPTSAIDRLSGRYYNEDAYSATNPGGLDESDDGLTAGHVVNFPAALVDIGDAAAYVGAVADTITAAQSTITMAWDAATAVSDPGAGKLRATTATPAAGSYSLLVSVTDGAGADVSGMLAELGASSSAAKARARMVKVGDTAKYLDLQVTGITVAAGYRAVAVTCLAGPGGFAAGDAVALGWVRTGDAGQAGAPGAGPAWAGTSGGAANAQTLTPSAPLPSLTGNPSYEFLAGYSITGAATLNVSGTGAASIRRADGTAAGGGDVVAGTKYVVTLVSGQWRLSSGAAGAGPVWYGTSGGTANAQTLAGPLTTLAGNPSVEFIAGQTNGPVTRSNICYPSADFGAPWAAFGAAAVTINTTVAPDGTIAADTVNGGVGAGVNRGIATPADTVTRCYSVYVKAGTSTACRVYFNHGAVAAGVNVDLTAGAISAWTGAPVASGIEAIPGGWWRIFIATTNNSSTVCGPHVFTVQGSGSGSVNVWGAQIEAGSTPTTYIPTTTGAVTVTDGYVTLAVGSTTARPLLDYAGQALNAAAVTYGRKYVATYDGSSWRLAGGVGAAAGATWCGVAAGTANALTLTPATPLPGYTDGATIAFVTAGSENTGAVTVSVSGQPPVQLVSVSGYSLSPRDLKASTLYEATYYSGTFRLAGTAAGGAITTTGLLCRIDAGDAACYSTGQTLANLVASPADGLSSSVYAWARGASTSAGSDDPTFNGSSGGMSASEYFGVDGGDFLSLDAASNTTFLDSVHKGAAIGTIAAWVYLVADGAVFGTGDSNAKPGFYFRVHPTAPYINFTVYNGSGVCGTYQGSSAPAANSWAFVAMSFAEGVSNGSFFAYNGIYSQVGSSNTFTLSYTSPSTSAAGRKAAWLDYGAASGYAAVAGTRIAQAFVWNRALTKAELDATFNATRARYGV